MILRINDIEIGEVEEYIVGDLFLNVTINKIDTGNIKQGCTPGLGGR